MSSSWIGFWMLAGFFGIIPLVLILTNWRKIVNPIVKLAHAIVTYWRKREYLPPRIMIEGLGANRALDVYEALVSMEKESVIVLGTLLVNATSKRAVRMLKPDPLLFEVARLLPDDLSEYERDFCRACREKGAEHRKAKLVELMIRIVRSTTAKMRGFSLKETVAYYRGQSEAAAQSISPDTREVILQMIGNEAEFTGRVTKQTNPYRDAPVFPDAPKHLKYRLPLSGRWHGGVGGHGGCAGGCACAGCACACAGGGH